MYDPDPLVPLVDDLRDGNRSADAYLDTLAERIDAAEPTVRAFVDSPDWDRLDEAVDGEGPSAPLLSGVPVAVKDIFHVDGFPTRAGSDVPPEALAGPQADAVTSLTDAGALVLGKTVTAEFAYFSPGPTRNPHDPERTPGGSSSGSAAAVAAGFCPLALGTQTVGSVIRPAAFCGVVGFKPSYGRIPTDGVIPLAPSVDHVGTFTADVAGAALAASVLCSEWEFVTGEPDGQPTLGVPEGSYLDQATETGRDAFERHVETLADAGYEIRRVEAFESIDTVNDRHDRIVEAEAALTHGEWIGEYGDRYADETAALIESGREIGVGELVDARRGRRTLREQLHQWMDATGIDLWLSPAAPGPAPEGIDDTGDPIVNLPWTHAGLPTLGVPAETVEDGLPVGLQLAGRFGADEQLLSWGEEIADALPGVPAGE